MNNRSRPLTSSLESTGLDLIRSSRVTLEDAEYALVRTGDGMRLAVLALRDDRILNSFEGERASEGTLTLLLGPLNAVNAAVLRKQLPWLQPTLLGLQTSVGTGDRLGLATPGHVRAVRAAGGKIAPIFAQQSIREMERTGRTPQQVMDSALWGVFQENWQGGYGADADHLKTKEDIDLCLNTGFTFFTIDPGAHVDDRASSASLQELHRLAEQLPPEMQLNENGLLNQTMRIEHLDLHFDELTLHRAMVKYGRAVWHVVQMYRYLAEKAGSRPFELEVSVDETEQPTSHAEHAYIASELKRLGVNWVSLAPRFVGAFEKGVDYIGDVALFEKDIAGHAAIARFFGPYKLSLHSGSDKFSIYPAAMRQTRGLVHLKTAGTSYLEALRTIAGLDIDLFREIYTFARDHYETDKATYHVSAQLARAPKPAEVLNGMELLDQFDAREILHVTFGSVLKAVTPEGTPRFRNRIMDMLGTHSEAYAASLEKHFARHLAPFVQNHESD